MKIKNSNLDIIIREYINGESDVYPLAPDYDSALAECRVAMKSGNYASFRFWRIGFPECLVECLNYITPEFETGPSNQIVALEMYPEEFQRIVFSIAALKGILEPS
jgi:hypothetical protein